VANTTVTTDAAVSVSVVGRNFAPIRVLIEAFTSIANWGSASSTSGSATAGGEPAGGSVGVNTLSGGPASSGDAQATGAQVRTQTNLASSASVRVLGDNHSPINIILTLAANFLNWGIGDASSGSAQSDGGADQTAGALRAWSGTARATGLQVENNINLKADASVAIGGDNYAPLFIWIRFNSAVDDRGWAKASTGSVQTGGTASGSGSGPAKSTAASQSGPAKSIGDTLRVTATSQQSANANGIGNTRATNPSVQSAAALTVTSSGAARPSSGGLPTTHRSLDLPGASVAASGPALSGGMDATVDEQNSQTSACAALESVCISANAAGLFVVAEPASPVEPAVPALPSAAGGGGPHPGGGAGATGGTGGAGGVGGTSGTGGSNASQPSAGSTGSSHHNNLTAGSPTGITVGVDPWTDFPVRRLPPLPKQTARAASGLTVSQDLWATSPGTELLPPPAPRPARTTELADAQPPETAGVRTTALVPGAVVPGGQTGPAAPVGVEVPKVEPPLAFVDVAPWAMWPLPIGVPTPAQAERATPTEVPTSSTELLPADQAIAELSPPEPAQQAANVATTVPSPLVPFLLWSTAFLGFVAANTRRGRAWQTRLWRRWSKGPR
jgi:hypothetical protein